MGSADVRFTEVNAPFRSADVFFPEGNVVIVILTIIVTILMIINIVIIIMTIVISIIIIIIITVIIIVIISVIIDIVMITIIGNNTDLFLMLWRVGGVVWTHSR